MEQAGLPSGQIDTIEDDPALANRVQYLATNDPDKLRATLSELQADPGRTEEILNQAVTPAQMQRAAAPASQNPLGDTGFQNMLSGLEGFSMGDIAQLLLNIVNACHGLTDSVMGGLGSFSRSGELVASGNGGPGGPLQQAGRIMGAENMIIHHEDPERGVRTATLADQATPEAPGTRIPAQDATLRPDNPSSSMA